MSNHLIQVLLLKTLETVLILQRNHWVWRNQMKKPLLLI